MVVDYKVIKLEMIKFAFQKKFEYDQLNSLVMLKDSKYDCHHTFENQYHIKFCITNRSKKYSFTIVMLENQLLTTYASSNKSLIFVQPVFNIRLLHVHYFIFLASR